MTAAAIVFAVLAGAAAAIQVALTLGAPLGHLTLGGFHRGRLPGHLRVATAAQAALLGGMALAVLDAGGVIALGLPRWTLWAVAAVTALATLANAATPSAAERRTGLPLAAGMFLSALAVALG